MLLLNYSPRQIRRHNTSVFILTEDVNIRKKYSLFVTSESSHGSSNVKELMTRDYWVASRGSQGLICIPHFSIHEVTTFDDRVEPKENHSSSAYSRRSNAPLKLHRVSRTLNKIINVSSIFRYKVFNMIGISLTQNQEL